jgi:hypothetical protein
VAVVRGLDSVVFVQVALGELVLKFQRTCF